MKTPAFMLTLVVALALLAISSAMVTDVSSKRTKTEVRKLTADIKSAKIRTAVLKSAKRLTRALRKSGCKTAVCLALQGTNVIPTSTYALQQKLTALTAAVVSADTRSAFAAVQYSLTTTAITPLTAKLPKFLKAVLRSKQARKPKTNMSAGLGYCWFQIRRDKRAIKRVVLLGSGDFNAGFAPKIVADSIARDKSDGHIVNVLTTGGKSAYVKNLSAVKKDIILLKNEAQLAPALEAVVGAACNL